MCWETYLITESNDLLLSNVQSEFVLSLVVELGKLHAEYLSTNGGSEVFNPAARL